MLLGETPSAKPDTSLDTLPAGRSENRWRWSRNLDCGYAYKLSKSRYTAASSKPPYVQLCEKAATIYLMIRPIHTSASNCTSHHPIPKKQFPKGH